MGLRQLNIADTTITPNQWLCLKSGPSRSGPVQPRCLKTCITRPTIQVAFSGDGRQSQVMNADQRHCDNVSNTSKVPLCGIPFIYLSHAVLHRTGWRRYVIEIISLTDKVSYHFRFKQIWIKIWVDVEFTYSHCTPASLAGHNEGGPPLQLKIFND